MPARDRRTSSAKPRGWLHAPEPAPRCGKEVLRSRAEGRVKGRCLSALPQEVTCFFSAYPIEESGISECGPRQPLHPPRLRHPPRVTARRGRRVYLPDTAPGYRGGPTAWVSNGERGGTSPCRSAAAGINMRRP